MIMAVRVFFITLGAVMIATGGDPLLGTLLIFFGIFAEWMWR